MIKLIKYAKDNVKIEVLSNTAPISFIVFLFGVMCMAMTFSPELSGASSQGNPEIIFILGMVCVAASLFMLESERFVFDAEKGQIIHKAWRVFKSPVIKFYELQDVERIDIDTKIKPCRSISPHEIRRTPNAFHKLVMKVNEKTIPLSRQRGCDGEKYDRLMREINSWLRQYKVS